MSLANQGGNSRSHHIHHHQRRRRQTNRFTFMTVAAIVSMSSIIPTIFASRGVGAVSRHLPSSSGSRRCVTAFAPLGCFVSPRLTGGTPDASSPSLLAQTHKSPLVPFIRSYTHQSMSSSSALFMVNRSKNTQKASRPSSTATAASTTTATMDSKPSTSSTNKNNWFKSPNLNYQTS